MKEKYSDEELRHLTQSYVTDRTRLAIQDWTKVNDVSSLSNVVNQGRYDLVQALGDYVLNKIEKFIVYIQPSLSGGIALLDERVRASVDEGIGAEPRIPRCEQRQD